ncbi:arsenate reductase (glutaredoxin) [Pseudoxanthomonas indica]|uniref:Arsenate reductase n=1 Tax=Pseudoxanthomonas indica TaxID=428993 RepID=A0A1T5IVW1_9GAMM|nr:arsenate reductase (glutaredoxin) [Pseudoxanthomonas indica]GGD54649.1 arsenate reductase [Pseudoxanthomonas indica]SKC43251.1 arsenate reductase [Pseudoxanthomonas indica]
MAIPGDGVTIYHNPACGTSRNVLAFLRKAGIEPTVIEYLQTPPDRSILTGLIDQMGTPVREVVRSKEALHAELGLDAPGTGDETLIEAMLAHPILINRPIVVSPWGVKLCRPSETVLDLLPPELAEKAKADAL